GWGRIRGRTWAVSARFAEECDRHFYGPAPIDAFDQWHAEWFDTGVKPDAWTEREKLTRCALQRERVGSESILTGLLKVKFQICHLMASCGPRHRSEPKYL